MKCVLGSKANSMCIWDDLKVVCKDKRLSNIGGLLVQGAHLIRDNWSLFGVLGGGFFSIYIFGITFVSAENIRKLDILHMNIHYQFL